MYGMALIAAAALIAGCGKEVTRIDPDTTVDLSGNWNDADSRMVAEKMIDDMLTHQWYAQNYEQKTSTPTIIVGRIRNKSHEHINTETFIKDLERELINSGKVDFVASKAEREQLREEKEDQARFATEETRQLSAQETGADLMLIGSINTIADQEGNQRIMYYQTDLELIEIESNKKLWIGTKKIKKHISRSGVRP
jgi:uncharacterized protein (TIGR02722 family)